MHPHIPHDHFCVECGALFACPNLQDCPVADDPDDYEGRIGLCPTCAPHTYACSHCGDQWDCVKNPCRLPGITICDDCLARDE